jgi:hypothetical protein
MGEMAAVENIMKISAHCSFSNKARNPVGFEGTMQSNNVVTFNWRGFRGSAVGATAET